MPHKFRRYVTKGYGRKGAKVQTYVLPEANSLVDSVVQTDLCCSTIDDILHFETESTELVQETVAVQTDTIIMKSDETQTDTATLDNLGTVETQTEVVEMRDAKIQVSELAEMKLCVGNYEEKFLPLVTKHKGVFKDVTGLYV